MNKFAKLKAVNRLLVKVADFSGLFDVDYVGSDDISAHKTGYSRVNKLLNRIISGQLFRPNYMSKQISLSTAPKLIYIKTTDGGVLLRLAWQQLVKLALAKKDADKLFDLEANGYHIVTGSNKPMRIKDIVDPNGVNYFLPQDFDKMYAYQRALKIRNMLLAALNMDALADKKTAPLYKQILRINSEYDKRRNNLSEK